MYSYKMYNFKDTNHRRPNNYHHISYRLVW